jgi:hypothetical protein
MTNLPLDQKLAFDTELSATLNGTTQLLGSLVNLPVLMLVKNQSIEPAFFADNSGLIKGTTMAAGEEIIFDVRANHGVAHNMSFPIGTSFYVTGTAGSGVFKVSLIYAY